MGTVGDLTEQALDGMIARSGTKWSEKYCREFREMVADVKAYRPMVQWDMGEQGPQAERWMIDAFWILLRRPPCGSV